MPNTGKSFVAGLAYCTGSPVGVYTNVLNIPKGCLVLDMTNGVLYQKTSTTDNSTFVILATSAGALTPTSIAATGAITSSAPTGGGIGYATGAGGAVTQITNRSTTVVLSKLTGQITTDTTSLAAGAAAQFIVTNTTVAIGDTIILSIQSGTTTTQTTAYVNTVAAGSFKITVNNGHASTAEVGAIIMNFSVIKAVAA